ncbi:hypothetical protein O7626_12130 [Micromonospora sp. WMMD1102]|uniref:hypothetical protein n=1 Tax=Micromonospora sp. WMMD1102 TaxID=3016105 RepID=UPI00241517A3|nr:hypothetical protein [Micromonospora sp. WMMD1102]MDG4786671.1 hypothetical protein [Micromonospora sp. WMMD1102]
MSPPPPPDDRPVRKLVWASDELLARIGQQVQPRTSLPRRVAQAATTAVLFSWPPAFVVFAVSTVAAPSLTNGASVGRAAFWALQFAILVAVTAAVTTLVRRSETAEAAPPGPTASETPETPNRDVSRVSPRIALYVLVTAVCASSVLALHGLSVSQTAILTIGLVVVLHLLPAVVARLLRRSRSRRRAQSSP